FFVTFYPDVLAPRLAFQMDGMSPFVASVHYFEDYQLFKQHDFLRTQVREKFWGAIKRAVVHYERQQWDLWEPEIRTILEETPERAYAGRLRQMFECFEYSVQWFTFDRRDIWRI